MEVTNCCAGHVEISHTECVPNRSRHLNRGTCGCRSAELYLSHIRSTTSGQNCIELHENRTDGLVADTTSEMDMVPT